MRAQTLDLATLMQRMARRKGGEARFTEERHVGGLNGPLTSSGTLSYAAPDRFTRQTVHPTRETMELDGRTLRLVRGNRTRQMDLEAVPEVAALLEAMRATLTGDAALLRRHFRVDLTGTDAKWVLELRPLDERLARQVSVVEIVGQAADVRSVLLQLPNGDRSLMLIEPLVEKR
ncbi:MAG: LolA-related protein [Rubrivivax sp.]